MFIMVSLKIEIRKRDVTWVVLLIVVLAVGVGYAYGSSNPSVIGHSWGEVECNDCIGASNIATDAVGNSELIDNPSFSSISLGWVSRSDWPSGGTLSCVTKEATGSYSAHYGRTNVQADCPQGYIATGGGCNVGLLSCLATYSCGPSENGWSGYWEARNNPDGSVRAVSVKVRCCKIE